MQIIRSGDGHGALLRALAVSVVFHLLLLWPAATVWDTATPSAPLVASLRPSMAPVAPARPTVAHQPTRPPPAPPQAIVAEQGEARAPDTPISTASPVTGSEAQPSPPVPVTHPVVASALPASAGVDAEGLRAYRMALAVEARRYKRYPARAIEEGWNGTTELRIARVSGQGAPHLEVIKSSGYPLLDEAALEMVRKALPATPVPGSLRDRAFTVDLPIVFDLPQ